MVEMLGMLAAQAGGEDSALLERFSTHPISDKRVENVRAILKKTYPDADGEAPDPAAKTFLNIRNRLGPPPPAKTSG